MNEDPNFDGPSLLIVGTGILAAGGERPALGLALGREHRSETDGSWFVGTRVARAPARDTSDVRFDGGAPPLSALARRFERGEFGQWFGALKADEDAGRVFPIRLAARVPDPGVPVGPSEALAPGATPPAAAAPPVPGAEVANANAYGPGPGDADADAVAVASGVHRISFPSAPEAAGVRARAARH